MVDSRPRGQVKLPTNYANCLMLLPEQIVDACANFSTFYWTHSSDILLTAPDWWVVVNQGRMFTYNLLHMLTI